MNWWTDPPWWGIPVVAGTFAILGALANGLHAQLTDALRFKRERSTRWDRDVRDTAARFLTLAEEARKAGRNLREARDRPVDDVGRADELKQRARETSEALSALRETYNQIALVGPSKLINPSSVFLSAIMDATGLEDPPTGSAQAIRDGRTEFTRAVRKFLGSYDGRRDALGPKA